MFLVVPVISSYSNLFIRHFEIIPSTPITSGTTVTFMFYSFLIIIITSTWWLLSTLLTTNFLQILCLPSSKTSIRERLFTFFLLLFILFLFRFILLLFFLIRVFTFPHELHRKIFICIFFLKLFLALIFSIFLLTTIKKITFLGTIYL